jgi:hypothetical protein
MRPAALQDEIATMHTTDCGSVNTGFLYIGDCALTCTKRRKKLRLKSVPLTTYLFATVIKIELPQYVRMDISGLSTTDRNGAELCCMVGGGGRGGAS